MAPLENEMQRPDSEKTSFAAEEQAPSDSSSGEDELDDRRSSAGPPRKRKKSDHHQITSCELCKARKVKCDRAQPACSWCARRNRTCVYLERQKPGSRIVFGLQLEAELSKTQARLEELERRFDEHLNCELSNGYIGRAASPPRPGHQAPAGHDHTNKASVSEYGQHTPLSQSHSATPPISKSSTAFRSRRNSDSRPRGDGVSEASARFTPLSLPIGELSTGLNVFPSPYPMQLSPRIGNDDLPQQDMLYMLVDLYFKHCNTWCPILDRKSTFGLLSACPHISEENRVLLHAIVATTMKFFRDTRTTTEMRARQYSLSKRTVQMYAMDHVSVPALRARVILCLDILGTSNGPCGGVMMALLSQAVKQLGLCSETSVFLTTAASETASRSGLASKLSTSRPSSWIEDEGRRRLCWMVYILDRYATMAGVTPNFTLEDSAVRRVLPCSYDLFSRDVAVETPWFSEPGDLEDATRLSVINKSENLGSFSYHCEMIKILSKVHDFATAPLDISSSSETATWRNTYRQLDNILDGWLQSLPGEYSKVSALCHSDPASRVANWFMLHSAYVVAVVRLHSSAAYPIIQSHLFIPSDYAMQRCMSAVQSLGGIVQDVREAEGLELLGPLFAFSLWVAARLLLVHSAALACPVDPMIDPFITTLEDIGKHWEVARCYSRILARVVQRVRQGDGTWAAARRSAHALVSLTSSNRESGVGQTSTQTATQRELDNVEVFDFFNYPRQG
ncbi:related to Zn(II)2Cys6 transcriptional activator [Cephalotrichum gorgonifer]|uniref:Related to Zn(II)2Cys6 transcriptional activator n=1 Tax=Cephalotrichum gorgonifer TaxID=2041049 RepID=A0AAE8SZP9_9PEZI|nr:related to Zn(II)2Cys6 transcriptional activator [Cephalotrichum gorgonifer]